MINAGMPTALCASDAAKGFGGKFGVQSDRVDKTAVGWEHHEDLSKHESQKGAPASITLHASELNSEDNIFSEIFYSLGLKSSYFRLFQGFWWQVWSAERPNGQIGQNMGRANQEPTALIAN
jgi:hypothetical protein